MTSGAQLGKPPGKQLGEKLKGRFGVTGGHVGVQESCWLCDLGST
jgi:hypothetical protein